MTVTTLKKKQKLRNNEYYNMQDEFDELHKQSSKGKIFTGLISLISCEDNILLAYRNIKNNEGSTTAGTDGRTIKYYKEWTEGKFVKYFQDKFTNYHPKSVRRVEIPKPHKPEETRPLGIPCMDDRIIQQCIKQVMEPICEAKFHNHSYGFRPNRATSHAIARANFLMWKNQLHYVVDIDIKGFFDNVSHGKLLKQIWHLGIHDKNLLCIISKILKSEIEGIGKPGKGTPQGGIISPLLSNIVLNELDWWLSDQWETKSTKHLYCNKSKAWHMLRKSSNLKEFFLVRYADDFKIFCKDYQAAQKIYAAAKLWLKDRLGLEINPEKSKITNVRKGKTEFLGLALHVRKEAKKDKDGNIKKDMNGCTVMGFVTPSNISDKAKKAMTHKLKEQIKVIQQNRVPEQVNKLNSMILGMHNYYNMASLCSKDFGEISFIVNKSLHNRLEDFSTTAGGIKKKKRKPEAEPEPSKTYQKLYGDYKCKRTIVVGVTIFLISGCKYHSPSPFAQETCNYTELGRQLIHKNLTKTNFLTRWLLDNKVYDRTVEYNDNRISLMAGQNGKCYVTGEPLLTHNMACHHKIPSELGGDDKYGNLVWLRAEVHILIHATNTDTIRKYLSILNLDKKALEKVNSLRKLAENLEISDVA